MKEVEKAMKKAEVAAQKWLNENEPNIENIVTDMLDQRLVEIVAKLLGFNNSWGEWALDHCNGRSGESSAGDYLREKAGIAVKVWLDSQAKNLPNLPIKATSSIKKEYLECLEQEITDECENIARERAVKIAEEICGSNPCQS
jgi:vacuolar-type H+-ATPase subunit H